MQVCYWQNSLQIKEVEMDGTFGTYGKNRSTYSVCTGKYEGKRQLGKPTLR
jgi:hypothetical protein